MRDQRTSQKNSCQARGNGEPDLQPRGHSCGMRPVPDSLGQRRQHLVRQLWRVGFTAGIDAVKKR
jgi:hypothetical protein